jgi:hypothetical protein
MDNIGHMPNAYLCALDQLGNGDRTAGRLNGLIDHFERSTGLQNIPEMNNFLPSWRDATHQIAARRYYDFSA